MQIITPFDEQEGAPVYRAHISRLLKERKGEIPQIKWQQWPENQLCFSVSMICLAKPGASRFFFEMISRWLLPGKYLTSKLTFSAEFQFTNSSQVYIACETVFCVAEKEEAEILKKNFPFLKKEILIGVSSFYHAGKILEMKGLSLDEKTGLIQERIASLVRRFPKRFDYDIFSEMQHFLVTSKESFKAVRDCEQMSRIIWVLYWFRKELERRVEEMPGKRHLCLKMRPAFVQTPFGAKTVLSIFVGLNFLKEHELFEERHFLSAMSRFVPSIQIISESYFARESSSGRLHGFYLEVEKQNSLEFAKEELIHLHMLLPDEIKRRIEQLVAPIFMPRNEEEVMRNVLTLSHQLKYTRDLPQVILSFDEQTDIELSFTVVLVRVLQPGITPIRELLNQSALAEQVLFDRVKIVGMLRRRYPKEAAIFRIRLPSEQFLREDYSVDLYSARQSILQTLQNILGEVRDFNGGMIAKQNENFMHLKSNLGELASKEALLLQNFFHSIFPAHLSTTLDPKQLQLLFHRLLQAMENQESAAFRYERIEEHLFVMVKFGDLSWKQRIFTSIEELKIPFNELLSMQMQVFDSFYVGFIYLEEDWGKQEEFLQTIPDVLECSLGRM